MSEKKIILVGAGGAGKDYLRQKFQDRGFRFAVTDVTRPKRQGEVDGVDCNFITKELFLSKIDRDEYIEYDEFNGWLYGTSIATYSTSDVFIMTPRGIGRLKPKTRSNCFIIFIAIPQKIRKERLSKRRDADDVQRRLDADTIDFRDFRDYDLKITNWDF